MDDTWEIYNLMEDSMMVFMVNYISVKFKMFFVELLTEADVKKLFELRG